MPLDAQIAGVLAQARAMGGKPVHRQTVAEARAALAMMCAMGGRSTATLADVAERTIPGPGGDIPVRVYTPVGDGPFGLLCFFHGGGFVLGDLKTHDGVCRELAAGAECVVVAVDYRLGPEHKYPAAADDCEAATRWAHSNAATLNVDPSRIAVGGESAGGNLSAVVSQRLRDSGGPALSAQLLVYPAARLSGDPTPSMIANAEGYFLEVEDMVWFLGHYLADPAHADLADASPGFAADLAGLPPALVITAEFDPLCDDGEFYAEALRSAGVEVVLTRYDGAIHGFWNFFGLLKIGRAAMDESIAWLRPKLANPANRTAGGRRVACRPWPQPVLASRRRWPRCPPSALGSRVWCGPSTRPTRSCRSRAWAGTSPRPRRTR
ncbi:MAG: alpha/beta hydrolase [Sporichthyaceae bacterium]